MKMNRSSGWLPLAALLLFLASPFSPTAASSVRVGEGAATTGEAVALTAISATLARYATGVDEGDRAMLADTFTEGAVLEATIADRPPLPTLSGRAAIVDFILKGRAAQKDVRRHIITNIWIEKLDGAQATVRSYHLIVVTDNGAAQARSTGTYVDEMVRGQDGVWRTARKIVRLDAPY